MKMKNKIGIATVYTGFNYGSSLQAFATKKIVEQLGYEGEILGLSGSLIKGRDVRLGKLAVIAFRSMLHAKNVRKSLNVYHTSMSKALPDESISLFMDFRAKELCPKLLSFGQMKKLRKRPEYTAFFCGSDQIWNSTTFYVDPFYYLRFAPKNKRIAFAPSFGRDFIPDYNQKVIRNYISEIPYKSVREVSGVNLIKNLTGESVESILDPTLQLSPSQWIQMLSLSESNNKGTYILAYFLDTPSVSACHAIKQLKQETGLTVVGIPYKQDEDNCCDRVAEAGPKEFVQLLRNAAFVCTDSFHGTAFAVNFQIPFYTFERNYGNATKQSERIVSLLEQTGLQMRLNPECVEATAADFSFSISTLEKEREKAKLYLQKALKNIEDGAV